MNWSENIEDCLRCLHHALDNEDFGHDLSGLKQGFNHWTLWYAKDMLETLTAAADAGHDVPREDFDLATGMLDDLSVLKESAFDRANEKISEDMRRNGHMYPSYEAWCEAKGFLPS